MQRMEAARIPNSSKKNKREISHTKTGRKDQL